MFTFFFNVLKHLCYKLFEIKNREKTSIICLISIVLSLKRIFVLVYFIVDIKDLILEKLQYSLVQIYSNIFQIINSTVDRCMGGSINL